MLSKAIKSLFVLLVFSFSFFAFVPNFAGGQAVSIPGPTLYLGTVTSTPYESMSEMGSNGYATFLYGELGGYRDLVNIDPFLYDMNDSIIPDEFISYKIIPSNNTYILVLRPGLKWSNGVPINATTFYDMYIALAAIGSPAYWIKIVNSSAVAIQVPPPGIVGKPGLMTSPSWFYGPDDGGVCTETYPAYWAPYMKMMIQDYPQLVAKNATVINNLTSYIMNGPPSKIAPPEFPLVTNGPYMVSTVTPSEVILTRNPYYWDPSAWPWNSVVIYQFTSTSAEDTFLASGKIDFYAGLIPTAISSQMPSYMKTLTTPGNWGHDLIFNFNSNWVSQLQVREAIAYAINRTKVAEASGNVQLYRPLTYPLSVVPWMYSVEYPQSYLDTLNPYNTNLTKAAQLMESAGYVLKGGEWYAPNGTQVTLTLLTGSPLSTFSQGMVEDVVSQLDNFGIKTTLLETSDPTYGETGKGFNLVWGGWGGFLGTDYTSYLQIAEYENGITEHYMNWYQPVNVPGVGSISYYNLEAETRTDTPNTTQELIWLHGLSYIENHYVPDLPITSNYDEYTVNNQSIHWPSSDDVIFWENGDPLPDWVIAVGAQTHQVTVPAISIAVSVPSKITLDKPINLTATVQTLDSQPAPATPVRFTVNGVAVNTTYSNPNGIAWTTYVPTTSGTYTVGAQPLTNTTLFAKTIITIGAIPSAIRIAVSPVSITTGSPVIFSATVIGNDGRPMVGTSVNFFVNNAIVGSSSTNSSGTATLSYTPVSAGSYTVKAQSAINASVSATTSFTVAPKANYTALYAGAAVIIILIAIAGLYLYMRKKPEGTKK
ncbi:MAG: ABC transporter substrate-binding protein [Thermoprotei archaeon]